MFWTLFSVCTVSTVVMVSDLSSLLDSGVFWLVILVCSVYISSCLFSLNVLGLVHVACVASLPLCGFTICGVIKD